MSSPRSINFQTQKLTDRGTARKTFADTDLVSNPLATVTRDHPLLPIKIFN